MRSIPSSTKLFVSILIPSSLNVLTPTTPVCAVFVIPSFMALCTGESSLSESSLNMWW